MNSRNMLSPHCARQCSDQDRLSLEDGFPAGVTRGRPTVFAASRATIPMNAAFVVRYRGPRRRGSCRAR